MYLDLRRPTLVLLGTWNPAVFQPGWMARHLFGHPPGEQVRMDQFLVAGDQPKIVNYIDGLGIFVSTQRLEVYLNGFGEKEIAKLEQTAVKLYETLPHTPFGNFGVNFHFVVEAPDPALFDLLTVNDSLNKSYKITEETFVAAMPLEKDVVLNLSRTVTEKILLFDFNFHHKLQDPPSIKAALPGVIMRCHGLAVELMKNIYNIAEYTIKAHVEPKEKPGAGVQA
jgi:hypothetical protein